MSRLPSASWRVLAAASSKLAESIDYETTLKTVASLLLPSLGDGCVIDVVEPDGSIARIASSHVDPAKQSLATALVGLSAPAPDAGIFRVLATTEPQVVDRPMSEPQLRAVSRSTEHFEILRALDIQSGMTIALRSRGAPIGILWLYSSKPRRYTEEEIHLAAELVSRAATAVENARLFRRAEEAIALRDEFLTVASHELNTPLSSLSLLLESLLRIPQPERVATRLATARRQVARLERLVRQLLDVSRLVGGHVVPDGPKEEVDLSALVRDNAASLEDDLTRHRTTLTLDLPPDGVAMGRWDRGRIEQVFCNLLANAMKYGEGQPIEVVVSAGESDVVELTVRDHGIGVAPEHQERIFQRFERAVSSRNYGGLGLGLWIAREIVVGTGGTIAVTSNVGEGSTFTVRLPRRVD